MGGEEKDNLDFITDKKMKVVFLEWLEYKKDRKEKYKSEKSLQIAYKKFVKLSDNNSETAKEIVEQSMANNWAGLFELKNNEKNWSNNKGRFKSNTTRRNIEDIQNDLDRYG